MRPAHTHCGRTAGAPKMGKQIGVYGDLTSAIPARARPREWPGRVTSIAMLASVTDVPGRSFRTSHEVDRASRSRSRRARSGWSRTCGRIRPQREDLLLDDGVIGGCGRGARPMANATTSHVAVRSVTFIGDPLPASCLCYRPELDFIEDPCAWVIFQSLATFSRMTVVWNRSA